LFAATVLLSALLALTEARVADPLVDIRELIHRPTLMTHLVAFLFGALSYIFYVTLPAYAETPRRLAGYGFTASVAEAGLIMLPSAIMLLAAGTLTGRVTARMGPRWPVITGFALAAAAAALLALAHTQIWEHAVFYAVIGVGSGLVMASLPRLIVDVVPPQRTGVANGINNIIRTVGGVTGTQITAAILASSAGARHGIPADSAFSLLFWLAAGASAIGIILAPFAVKIGRPPAADSDGEPAVEAVGEASL
jgi:MFS family permease